MSPGRRRAGRRAWAAIPLTLGIGLALASCTGEPGRPDAPREEATARRAGPSLLLVTLDTFRADAAGCGGHPTGRTPHLDRLARAGVQFETGLAATPLTLPSHTSMLTGLDPPAHGVRDNGTFRLPEGIPTIAEALRAEGFATGAFLGGFPLDERFGLSRGFDVYDDRVSAPGELGALVMAQRSGAEVTAAAASWLGEVPADRRWFAFVHLFDAHTPYDAPRPWRNAAGGDAYLGDIAWTDHFLGRAVREARAASPHPRIVVLGDHGESRGDHQEANHGLFVYGATIRVPAVVWPAPPGIRPGLRRGTFRAIDVPATAFDLLGLAPGASPGQGTSAVGGEVGPAYMETLYPLYHHAWSALRALQEGNWKYVQAPEPELYDLASDPGERVNVADDHPERAARMARLLREITAQGVSSARVELDETARRSLESLGYLTGGTGGPELGEEADLPDPKRMIAVQNLLEGAQMLLSAGQPEAALRPLSHALARDPKNKDLHQTYGLAYAMAGRHAQAVDSFLRCLELPPHRNDRIPRFELASSYLRLDKPEEAIRHLKIILDEDAEDAATWYNMGEAQRRLGQARDAREAWRRALEIDPGFELARRALGLGAPPQGVDK